MVPLLFFSKFFCSTFGWYRRNSPWQFQSHTRKPRKSRRVKSFWNYLILSFSFNISALHYFGINYTIINYQFVMFGATPRCAGEVQRRCAHASIRRRHLYKYWCNLDARSDSSGISLLIEFLDRRLAFCRFKTLIVLFYDLWGN